MHTVTKYKVSSLPIEAELSTLVKQNAGNCQRPRHRGSFNPHQQTLFFFLSQNLDIVEFLLQSWNTVAGLQAVKLL